ncbi:coiled-coil domain-containing protein 14 [Cyrtonyx montezumae]|uniref:coiled-coil domain-containing protein 14 n=1 Tax=Cyrtonyx montezumae TaxID=9017 RepID=UPI0032DBD84B
MAMGRAGAARPRKALCAGGAAGPTDGRKQRGLRKGCHREVEGGYCLYSTDSDDQVNALHNGLDRCAALLKNILEKEATGKETIHKQPGKTKSVKNPSKPLPTKANTLRKKGLKKYITTSHVRKEIVPIAAKKLASSTTPSTVKELPSAVQHQLVGPVHVPCSQQSVIREKLCEHVQTQMSLTNGQPSQINNGIPTVTSFSTSDHADLALQNAAHPLSTQADASIGSGNECVPQMGETAPTPAQIQSANPLRAVMSYVASGASSNSAVPTFTPLSSGREMTPSHEQQSKADLIRCIKAHLTLLQTCEVANGRTEQKQCHCLAAHNVSSNDNNAEEHSEDMVSEGDLNVLDVSGRDASSQQSCVKKDLKPQRESADKTAHKVKTVKYLMGELRALITDQDDSEMLRLMNEIEDCISLLPAVVGSTNIQTEIALALQPLRSENTQLRRKLRILNQQLREQERNENASGQSCSYELASLQSLNVMLQTQLKESLKGLESLQAKNEELLKVIRSQKEENKCLAKDIQDKENELLENKQQFDIHSTKLKIKVEEALANVKSLQFKLEASEKENKILGITLRHRDAEVNRLRDLTRTLQGSVAKLMSDLTADSIRPTSEKGLSKSLLDDHEMQMQPDPCPGNTSIMTYLKKLEMDHILTDAELQFTNKDGELQMLNQAYEKFAGEGTKISHIFSERASASRVLPTLLKQDAEMGSNSGTLIDERSKLDETVYIPLTSSVSKKQLVSERTNVLPHVRGACKMLDYNCELSNSMQQNRSEVSKDPATVDTLNAGYSMKVAVENSLEITGDKGKPGDQVQARPKGPLRGAAKDFSDKPGQLQLHVPTLFQKEVFQKEISQKKGGEVGDTSSISFDDVSGKSEWSSSFSTFTSQDEEDFKNGLAVLDANIARLQRTLQNSIMK